VREGGQPRRAHLDVVASGVGLALERSQFVEQPPTPDAQVREVTGTQVGGIPRVRHPEQPARQAQSAEPGRQAAGQHELVDRQALSVGSRGPECRAQRERVEIPMAVVEFLELTEGSGRFARRRNRR